MMTRSALLDRIQANRDTVFGCLFLEVRTPQPWASQRGATTNEVYDTGSDGGSQPGGDGPDEEETGGGNPNNSISPDCADDWYKDED